MENITITLKVPLKTREGAELTQITLAPPKVRDLRLVPDGVFTGEKNNPTAFVPMIASMTGVSEETLQEMDVRDLITVAGVVSDFLAQSPAIGKK